MIQLGQISMLLLLTTILTDSVGCNVPIDAKRAKAEIVYQWNIVEYEWPNAATRQRAINDGTYLPKNSAINGIKLYKNRVFVTVSRFKGRVPSTLNEVVENTNTAMTSVSHVLRPFPSWDMHTLGDCKALQRVQSMEIDPKSGHMWIVDTGYIPSMDSVGVQPLDACPAKIIVYDINNNKEIRRFYFPTSTIGYGIFYLDDIVLEVENGAARYAYMADTLDYKLVVYDFLKNTSYAYSHPNMGVDKKHENIIISNLTLTGVKKGINGIAMSPDFKYVYYSSVAGVGLHQIDTGVLKHAHGNDKAFAASVRTVGTKVSPGDGMAYGSNHNLYYSALGSNSVYKWDIKKDLDANSDFEDVSLTNQSVLVTDPRMDWIDTLALDSCGYLWFTTTNHKFFSANGIVQHEPNFYVWKVYVDDYNYLDPKWYDASSPGSAFNRLSLLSLVGCVLIAYSLLL